jgi:hypothetical protein
VATGLGRDIVNSQTPPMRVITKEPNIENEINPNYRNYEKPTNERKKAVGDGLQGEETAQEYLDIPAFLRRQAD